MDIKIAAQETQKIAARVPAWPNLEFIVENGIDRFHVMDMMDKIMNGEVTGEKAHRWLGWAQCAIVCTGASTLKEMIQINVKE